MLRYGSRTGTAIKEPACGTTVPHLGRLVEFAEPAPDDVCLDVAYGGAGVADALTPCVSRVTSVDAAPAAPAPNPGERFPTVVFPSGGRNRRDGDRGDGVRGNGVRGNGVRGNGRRDALRPTGSTGRHRAPTPATAPAADATAVRADAAALPYRSGTFSLVMCRSLLNRTADPAGALRELLRVCAPGGRLVVADLVRTRSTAPERDRLERLHDPGHPGTPSVARLMDLVVAAGADVRRVDVFSIERPIEPWLAQASDPSAAARIREALLTEVDGGPRTGAKPRLIGGELWFTQSWAYLAAQPLGS